MTPVHGFIPQEPLPDYFAPKPPTTGAPWHIPLLEQGTPLAPLIGLGGKLRAGKDAVGDYLEEHHGYTKLGMSDALNEALQNIGPKGPWINLDFDVVLGGITPESKVHGPIVWKAGEFVRYRALLAAVGYVEAKKHKDVREYLQGLGTEVGREMIDQDVWVKIAERKITELRAQGKPVVITAMRFPNETHMLEALGGTSIWIERPSEVAEGEIAQHASETSVGAEDFQYTIVNDGTLDELYSKVEGIMALRGTHVLPKTFGG